VLARVLRKVNHHRTTELYFVGYPKTGNTWLRYMLGRYTQLVCGLPELPLFDATDRLGRCERFCVGPAMQFTHRPLLWGNQKASDLDFGNVIHPFESKRIVLIIRHPLDTMVSHWMQRKHRMNKPYEKSLIEFIDDPVWGIEKFFDFYSLWFNYRDKPNGFLLIRYEDMRADPAPVFTNLLKFLGISMQEKYVQQAVQDADFDVMKKIEVFGHGPKYRWSGKSIFASGDISNPDALHVRRGEVGGFVNYLETSATERLVADIEKKLPVFFGYSNQSQQAR
jgi:sulfotransferase family protein